MEKVKFNGFPSIHAYQNVIGSKQNASEFSFPRQFNQKIPHTFIALHLSNNQHNKLKNNIKSSIIRHIASPQRITSTEFSFQL